MKIKDIPWYNRPGTRLKRNGATVLSDAELLAIVLGRGNSKENAIDISNRVLNAYNFNGLSSLNFQELKREFKNQVPALRMLAMFEIFRRTDKIFKKDDENKILKAPE
jgi:DNA repair protein RadC